MPTWNPDAGIASSTERIPGRWLCVIPREGVTLGDKHHPGVETIDQRTGQLRRSKKGDEQWNVCIVVIDDMPGAPAGEVAFDSLTWDNGKAQARIQALLQAMGHEVRSWTKQTAITPEMLYDRSFVAELVLDDRGYFKLEYRAFSPQNARRGAASGGAAEANGGGTRKGKAAAGGEGGGEGGGACSFSGCRQPVTTTDEDGAPVCATHKVIPF